MLAKELQFERCYYQTTSPIHSRKVHSYWHMAFPDKEDWRCCVVGAYIDVENFGSLEKEEPTRIVEGKREGQVGHIEEEVDGEGEEE